MAPLKLFIVVLILVEAIGQSLAQDCQASPPRLPANVFEQSPYSWNYYNWWRPYRTIFNPEKVSEIQRRVDAITTPEARCVNLEDSLGSRATSSFLYPVLAANGAKGRIILERYLSEYANGARLDDRWLLIIAALGRNASAETQEVLENEFDRILKEYSFPGNRPSNGILTADARLPVADALLACMAAEQTLTAQSIEKLVQRIHGTPQNDLLWMIGLEWARALTPEEKVLEILEDAFSGCTDAELLAFMNGAIEQSGRVSVLVKFSSGPADVWALTRGLLLRKVERRNVVSDYLLTLYTGILTSQADSADGAYQLDEDVISAYCNRAIRTNRFLAMHCWVLARCRPSQYSRCWEQFLAEHGSNLHADDETAAQNLLKRILDPHAPEKTPELRSFYDETRKRPFSKISKPGVHLMGFRGAGGRPPTISLPEPKRD